MKKQTKETKEKKIAIFDIDGTIFRKNLHFELINELSWLKVFPNAVRRELTEVYSGWLDHSGTYEDYRKAIVRIYAEHIKGVSEVAVGEAARIVVPFHARRTYLFSETLIKELREKDYHLLAISGSPIEIVEEYNEHYLHFDRVFGSVYSKDEQGIYTGVAEFEPSRNKGEVLQQYVYEHGLTLEDSYGVGDTESDGSFLRMVTHPIAFNPNQNLKAMADEEGWRIVLEKKDVIYEIAQKR
ncbi:MAG: HAD family phosphatase [Candidatus Moraniibacteriota bacterium]